MSELKNGWTEQISRLKNKNIDLLAKNYVLVQQLESIAAERDKLKADLAFTQAKFEDSAQAAAQFFAELQDLKAERGVNKLPEGCMWAVTKGMTTICQPPRRAHQPVPDGKVLVDAKELRTILGCCVELSPCAEPECKQPQSECLSYIERKVEAMLQAAQGDDRV